MTSEEQAVAVELPESDRTRSEARLHFANALLGTIFESSPDGILVVDAQSRILSFNQRFLDIWGIPRDMAEAHRDEPMLELVSTRARDSQAFLARVEHLYAHPEERGHEDIPLADGRVLDRRSGVLTDRDRCFGRVWFFRDVTAERQALERLDQTLRRTQSQLQATALVSHAEALVAGDVQDLARQITEIAAGVCGCERVNVWLFNEPETELRCIDLFEASTGRHTAGMVLSEDMFRHEFEALKAARYVEVDDPLSDPRTAGYVEPYIKPLRITSMLDAVIRASGRNLGVLCFEHVDKAHRWERDEIAFACQLADKIGLALVTQLRRQSEEKLRAVTDTAQDAIVMVDAKGYVQYWNPAAERILQYGAAEALGRDIRVLLAPLAKPDQAACGIEAFAAFAASGIRKMAGRTAELTARRKDGQPVPIELSVSTVTLGAEHFAVGVLRDISERKQAEQAILKMARYDGLTGLANRRVFVEAVQQAIARTRRGDKKFAVLYLDLDHFKDVNDTLGHPAGDALLRAVAERLRHGMRDIDAVARFGGDEFAVLAVDLGEPGDAAAVADKLLRALGEPYMIDGTEIHSGASIGIAFHEPDVAGAEALLSHADLALYKAKSEGRGTYRYFTETMDSEVRTRVTLAVELRDALAADELRLVYQPQVDIRTGQILGVEALVRWPHARRGLLSPAAFVASAEKSGLIGALGRWVLSTACRQAKQWADRGIAPPFVAVNVSAIQMKAPLDFENDINAALVGSGLAPNRLEIELTETALMEATREHNDLLERLRRRGIRLAIDDFGTGYSSLDYLRRFPMDRIKIAQNFVAGIGGGNGDTVIVKAAIGLARELGLSVIAEGVETLEQLEILRSWGCSEVQGYCFSKPLPAAELEPMLRKGRFTVPQVRSDRPAA